MTGFTAARYRFMYIFTGKGLLIMAGETNFITFGLEQSRFGRIVKFVTGLASPVFDRFVMAFYPFQRLTQVPMAAETESRFRKVQIDAADQTMAAVASAAIFFFDRAVDNPLAEPLPVLGMTIQARTPAPGSGTLGNAGRQSQCKRQQQKAKYVIE